ncbi:hypothetical protein [Streptomyces sp. NPDC088350]
MTARLVFATATAYGRTGRATTVCPVRRHGAPGLRVTPTTRKGGGA